ncbi:MAG: hypothetical protein K2H60_14845 [Muribaculaceae bacterium]|nr:hypothetical protein [Muribaculaceae bacterium]
MKPIMLKVMKPTIPIFKSLCYISLCTPIFAINCQAQSELPDSISTKQELQIGSINQESHIDNLTNTVPGLPDNSVATLSTSPLRYDPLNLPLLTYQATKPIELNVPELRLVPGQAIPFSWQTGEVVATGGTVEYPGLMKIDTGSIGVYQRLGNLSLYAGAMANKYGFFRGVHTQYGLNGSLSYSFSPRLSLTAFGTYYFGMPPTLGNGLPMPPAMFGYYGVSRFGGYVSYDVSEHFGVDVGAQTVQQVGTQKYKPEPIVTPYVKVGNGKTKVKIGLPVGQIVHGIIRSRYK